MFIAFEGPDNTGKSTAAMRLDCAGQPDYNMTKAMHAENVAEVALGSGEQLMPHTYDRIDWFTHMVYRLSMPERDWNDDRPRTVFAMPDVHLVVRLHHPDLAPLIDDELYETGKLALVNPMYYYFGDFFMGLNEERGYALFRTVSLVEVFNDPRDGTFSSHLVSFSSEVTEWNLGLSPEVKGDDALLELLQADEQQRL